MALQALKSMEMNRFGLILLLLLSSPAAFSKAEPVPFLPINCAELIPDNTPFVGFFNAVARGSVQSNPRFSKRILQILALGDQIRPHVQGGVNPVDWLVRKTLCFYREQNEPLRTIPYDDPKVIGFLKKSLSELEKKVDAAIFQIEFESARRAEYERQLQKNRGAIRKMEVDARKKAKKSFTRISSSAKRKAKKP